MTGGRLRAAPYAALALGVLAVAAYLCLVNLDYAALWHDEAPAALIGRNLLQRGDITGWDGRNLVGGTNGRTLNAELRDVLPPLTYVLNAAGMAVFGVNETGARIMPALIGVRPQYDVAARPDVFFYPTQRPEINVHAFTPLPLRELGVHILQRRPGDKRYQAAAALLRQQRYAEALATYREVLEIDPEHTRAQVEVGQTLFALERYEEAAHHFERALQLDPRNAEVLDYLALVRFRQERYEMALDRYRRLVEVSPDNAQAHANMGAALYYLGRLDEAARSFEHALSLHPGLETARSGLEGIRKSLAREAP